MSQPNAQPVVARPTSYSAWIGRTVDDRYRIDELLGEGGMGAVFLAEHLKLRKKVAFKVILPELAGSGELAKRFAREATASARLEHPHVASAIDYGTLPEGGAYLVMQYVRGESVRDVLHADGKLGWARACEVGAQIADALHAAHEAGIVHRDLKPDNVMLEARSGGALLVKVLDFGVAHVVEVVGPARAGTQLTRAGTIIGTPGYMAPEQALGEAIDFRTDLYALGVVMVEMITGNALYGDLELTAIVTRQLTEDAPRLHELSDDEVPDELDVLLGRLLAPDRSERPSSAAEVRDTLRGLALGETLRAVAGNPSLHDLSASELGRAVSAGRDPTPLAVPLSRALARTAERERVEIPERRAGTKITIPPPIAQALVRAKTTLADMRERVSAAGISRRSLVLAGTTATACAVALACMLTWALGHDADASGARRPPKREHAHPSAPLAPPAAVVDSHREIETPAALAALEAQLITGESARDREAAARAILDHAPRADVPPILQKLAELERARGCRERREIVVQLGAMGDVRALPPLRRLDGQPRNRCGNVFRRRDCLGCLRDELRHSIQALEELHDDG